MEQRSIFVFLVVLVDLGPGPGPWAPKLVQGLHAGPGPAPILGPRTQDPSKPQVPPNHCSIFINKPFGGVWGIWGLKLIWNPTRNDNSCSLGPIDASKWLKIMWRCAAWKHCYMQFAFQTRRFAYYMYQLLLVTMCFHKRYITTCT